MSFDRVQKCSDSHALPWGCGSENKQGSTWRSCIFSPKPLVFFLFKGLSVLIHPSPPPSFVEQRHNCVDEENNPADVEPLERPHVPLPHALAHPRAVVVQLRDARLAVVAVPGLGSLVDAALFAVPPLLVEVGVGGDVGGERGRAGHYSGVLAGRGHEEAVCEAPEEDAYDFVPGGCGVLYEVGLYVDGYETEEVGGY